MHVFYMGIGAYIASIKMDLKRFKVLLNQVEQGIMVVNLKDGNITHANKNARKNLKEFYGSKKLESKVRLSKCLFKMADMKEISSAVILQNDL